MDEDDLTRRAFAAYFRYVKAKNIIPDQPADHSGAATAGGKRYIVLRNANRVLAVYRVRNTGMLKRLDRWPKELEVW